MIVGFDTDDETVFELQRRFIEAARIPLAMINVLTAIPRTPLYERLGDEGRLDTSGDLASFGTVSTNVIPKRISRQALCDGYIDLMRDLYTPAAYFGRLDALYLDAPPPPPSARARYLRRHPWLSLKARAWTVLEVFFIITQLMRAIPDKALRHEYRRRLLTVAAPPPARMLRAYAIKCALHFHFDRLIAGMATDRAKMDPEVDTRPVAAPHPARHPRTRHHGRARSGHRRRRRLTTGWLQAPHAERHAIHAIKLQVCDEGLNLWKAIKTPVSPTSCSQRFAGQLWKQLRRWNYPSAIWDLPSAT